MMMTPMTMDKTSTISSDAAETHKHVERCTYVKQVKTRTRGYVQSCTEKY